MQLVRKEEKDEPMNDEDAADDEHGQVKKDSHELVLISCDESPWVWKRFFFFFRTIAGSEAEGDGDDDPAAHTSADAILRDFRYKLQCAFMEPSRDLKAWGVLNSLLGEVFVVWWI